MSNTAKIYNEIQELIKPIHAHADQMAAIACYIDVEYVRKTKQMQTTKCEMSHLNDAVMYYKGNTKPQIIYYRKPYTENDVILKTHLELSGEDIEKLEPENDKNCYSVTREAFKKLKKEYNVKHIMDTPPDGVCQVRNDDGLETKALTK